ncbi:Polyribonucleotide nucleotidyltransferase [bioreactor metagenome]|uniref:Polyribonucleotide nucleotidyltransferase n=1 Tax=bioreactor metagenome TaxID=1076179 RepID=A0A645J5Y7_9ZZZZ
MIHISKISNKRVEKVEDVLAVGDIVSAKLMEIDKQGRLNFSIKDALPQEEKAKEEKHSH